MELHQRKVRLGVKKRFFTGGQWAWNRFPRVMVMASRCWGSRSVWMMLSDIRFELV